MTRTPITYAKELCEPHIPGRSSYPELALDYCPLRILQDSVSMMRRPRCPTRGTESLICFDWSSISDILLHGVTKRAVRRSLPIALSN